MNFACLVNPNLGRYAGGENGSRFRALDMKAEGQREQERLRTRNAILDATEALMREEGYAAVTSRRVAERAGLKSQLVHYHFGTMDELFLELFRRATEKFLAEHLRALTSPDPLMEFWKFISDPKGIETVMEFVALGNHRKTIREELARATEFARSIQNALVAKVFQGQIVQPPVFPPSVLAFVVTAVARAIVAETSIGVTTGHQEIFAFIEKLLRGVTPAEAAGPAAGGAAIPGRHKSQRPKPARGDGN